MQKNKLLIKQNPISIEEYVEKRELPLTKEGKKILLEALKNNKFNFKYKNKIAQPGTLQGQNKIRGLEIHQVYQKKGSDFFYLDSPLYKEIIREKLDFVVDRIVQEINIVLYGEIDPRIKHILLEATEENVENLVDRIYEGADVIEEAMRKNNLDFDAPVTNFGEFQKKLNQVLKPSPVLKSGETLKSVSEQV